MKNKKVKVILIIGFIYIFLLVGISVIKELGDNKKLSGPRDVIIGERGISDITCIISTEVQTTIDANGEIITVPVTESTINTEKSWRSNST
jgi:hypothetical protein